MRKLFIILAVIIILTLALVLVLRMMQPDQQLQAPTEVAKPKETPLTPEQQSGTYTEAIAQKFTFPLDLGAEGTGREIAVDAVQVAGLNKANAIVTYTMTINDPRAANWAGKNISLFQTNNMTRYPLTPAVVRTRGSIVTLSMKSKAVPSTALLANTIALSIKPPTGAEDLSLLLVVPSRARPVPVTTKPAETKAPAATAPTTKAPATTTKKAAAKTKK